ncbi:winged helix-turn-helix transcriptional regulator [Virgibacillus salexigens]|uniref:winged helix-turn-helix transcriptional regulator n=1 Tax=Virgibacillus salexigens TaxID=61016 RepID=UPI00190DB9F8|nr:helix-turn-helix domain-containing protein [Virgibacillus salexigens]
MKTSAEEKNCWFAVGDVLQILGGKWAFLVLAELYKGSQRFNQLRRNLDDINTKSLTDTLRHLEKNEIIQRQVFPTVPVTVEYSLTEKGEDFQSVLIEMRNWRQKWEITHDANQASHSPE